MPAAAQNSVMRFNRNLARSCVIFGSSFFTQPSRASRRTTPVTLPFSSLSTMPPGMLKFSSIPAISSAFELRTPTMPQQRW